MFCAVCVYELCGGGSNSRTTTAASHLALSLFLFSK